MSCVANRDHDATEGDPWHVPALWRWSRVADAGRVLLGRQRSPANHDGPYMRPYVRAANITWAGWDFSDVKTMNFDPTDFERFRLRVGDVLINEGSGSAAEVGKPAIWRGAIEDCCFQNTLICVQPTSCTSEYLYYFLLFSAKSRAFVAETQGVNIYHIGREGLASFPIPLPPLAEQRRIVARIEALFARTRRARADLERVALLAGRYRHQALQHAFDDAASSSTPYGSARSLPRSKLAKTSDARNVVRILVNGESSRYPP